MKAAQPSSAGDIGAIQAHNFNLEIKHPATGLPVGLTIELRSTTSHEVRAWQKRIANKSIQLAKRGKRFTAEDNEQNAFEQLVAATVSFTWGKNAAGEDAYFETPGNQPKFSPEVAMRMYKNIASISLQVDEALGDDANFF